MNQISDPPLDYPAGQQFNYALWAAGTEVTLTNVPWDSTYRDVVEFGANRPFANINDYILAKPHRTLPKMSQVEVNRPILVNLPLEDAARYNYLRAFNPAPPVPGANAIREYYYFISAVNYLAPNTTQLVLQLDVFTTYRTSIKFGQVYVQRGHVGVADNADFTDFGRTYLTVPEGLDVGREYQTVHYKNETIMYPNGNNGFHVLVCSVADLDESGGAIGNGNVPKLVNAGGSKFSGIPSGANYYIFAGIDAFKSFLESRKEQTWITQGIISIKLIPNINRYYENFTAQPPTKAGNNAYLAPDALPTPIIHSMYPGWRDFIRNTIPEEYRQFNKFLTSPYCIVELTTWNGNPVILKPESWQHPDAPVQELPGLVPPSERLVFVPRRYNISAESKSEPRWWEGDPNGQPKGDDGSDYLDVQTQIANFPTMAILNNGAIAYMAANNATIGHSYDSADWSQQRALGANQAQYDVASSGMEMDRSLTANAIRSDAASTNIGMDTANLQSGLSAIQSTTGGAVAGSFAGGGPGAAAGAVSGSISGLAGVLHANVGIDAARQQFDVRNQSQLNALTARQDNSGFVRDTNKSLADWAARGDYANDIAGINAKVADAKLIQPTMSGQTGGETHALIFSDMKLSMRVKMIDHGVIRRIGNIWARYGYMVNRFIRMPDSYLVMDRFTYWKITESYIVSGSVPEEIKQAFRGIFEKGVTVWGSPDWIGQISVTDNRPVKGDYIES